MTARAGSVGVIVSAAAGLMLMPAIAGASNIASSTMHFDGALMDEGGGGDYDVVLAPESVFEVSQPVQVTSNGYYERGQSITFDGTDYWLFYGRSASCTDSYQTGNPDIHDYEVHYKKATSVGDLAGATATLISGAGVTHNGNSYLGETGAAYFGSEVWAFATIDVTGSADLYGWWTSDGGATWNEVGPIITGLSDGQAHHDEIAFGGELFVVEGSGDFTTMHSTTPKSGGWSSPVSVGTLTGGLVHFFIDGSDLYLAIYSSGANYIYKYAAGPPEQWVQVDTISTSGWDPTLFKVGSAYVFGQAPWVGEGGGRQYIISWSSTILDATFLDGDPLMVSEGRYGANTWVDMWPIGFTDNAGDSYLFYTSERKPGAPGDEITGNIWYLKVAWSPDNNHYTYIQEAIDAATGTTINVAAGTYDEDLEITKGLTLTTSAVSGGTIDGGIWIRDLHAFASPITVENFTIQNGTRIDATHDFGIKLSGDVGLADLSIVDMHLLNNTLVNCGKTDDVTAELWWNAAIFFDVDHFGALGSRYDSIFPGTGEISGNTIVNNLGDPSQRTQLAIGVRSGRNMKIAYNDISGNVAEGIHHWGPVNTASPGNYEIDHNTIDLSGWLGDPVGNNPRGIWSYARESSVSYNTVVSTWIGMVLSYWDDTYWGGATAADMGVTVSHNRIGPPGTGSMSVGLRISGNNSQITDNEIHGATDNVAGYGAGLMFEGWGFPEWGERTECADNTFLRNYVHDNYDGVFTWDAPYDNTFDNVFHNNAIVANTNYGLYNGHIGETIDAEDNWWGDASGPYDPGGTKEVLEDYGCDEVTVAEMKNENGAGNTVSDNDVDYCPWLDGPATISLLPQGGITCYGPGDTLVVEVKMTEATRVVVAGQFHINYDTGLLMYTGGEPGDPPFESELYDDEYVAGKIFYSASAPAGDPQGTADDTVMARLSFAVKAGAEACGLEGLVAFEPDAGGYQTKLSDAFGEVVSPDLNTLSAITIDDQPPVVICAGDISQHADAGLCTADVTWGPATADDNCDGDISASVLYDIDLDDDGGIDVSDYSTTTYTFPGGTHKVIAKASDTCGNLGSCYFFVTISGDNELVVDLDLSPTVATPLTRCITFELWECTGPSSVTVEQEITFTSGSATGVSVLVPCGSYDCITARDTLHTLRRTLDPLPIVGTQYQADFATPGKDLVGGNLNDDFWIDVLDFGVYSWQWSTSYGTGDTDCSTAYPHADINGDGLVTTADYTFIQVNFVRSHEANCCGEPGMPGPGEEGDGPIMAISVAELYRRGLGHLALGDLNGDGWLDEADIVAFLQGERPKGPASSTEPPAAPPRRP